MKKVTQEMFDTFIVICGIKQCPTGDYSKIKSFGKSCSFGERCSFGKSCSFGERCSFGKSCSFGEWCRFGESCSFGEWCSFENGHKAVDRIQPFYKFSGFSSRQMSETYIFNSMGGIFVRCGCFFGSVDDFKNRVIKEKGEDNGYLKIVDLYVNEIKKR